MKFEKNYCKLIDEVLKLDFFYNLGKILKIRRKIFFSKDHDLLKFDRLYKDINELFWGKVFTAFWNFIWIFENFFNLIKNDLVLNYFLKLLINSQNK